MYGHRRRLSAEETAANAARKEARSQAAMTCQCCFNKILANKGKIAHHGYQRPGEGWQTASCFGARELPFEVDRERLGELIVALKNHLKSLKETLIKLQNEEVAFSKDFYDRAKSKLNFGSKPVYTTLHFTRETFNQVMKDNEVLTRNCFCNFDDVKASTIISQETRIKHITIDIKNCEKRYAEWKQTHTWSIDHWELIK